MKRISATEFSAKYPTLAEYADKNGISQAEVMRMCGKKSIRNPKPYSSHRVVVNSYGNMSLHTEKTIKDFI
jgi:hypothetical protein